MPLAALSVYRRLGKNATSKGHPTLLGCSERVVVWVPESDGEARAAALGAGRSRFGVRI